MSLSLTLTHEGLDAAAERLRDLGDLPLARLLDGAGAILESGARRRIAEEKASPGGTPWELWSRDYAATRHEGHSLLMNEGDLLDSIQSFATSRDVVVGSNLVYAAHQHEGSEDEAGIPARPFLGMSRDDARDIEELVEDFIERHSA